MFVKLGVIQLNLYLEISTSVILLEILGVPGAPDNNILVSSDLWSKYLTNLW